MIVSVITPRYHRFDALTECAESLAVSVACELQHSRQQEARCWSRASNYEGVLALSAGDGRLVGEQLSPLLR